MTAEEALIFCKHKPLPSTSCQLPFRYGLYSSPFDPVLFDLEVSGSSCKNAFNSSIGVQSDEIDLSDILSGINYTLIHMMLETCCLLYFLNLLTVDWRLRNIRESLIANDVTPHIK